MGISQMLLLSILILLCTASCNTVDPPPDKTVLTLTLEDVSCTEAWITLTTNNLQLPTTLNLLKNNTITKTINLQTADTLLYIDSLLPNQTYKFQTISQSTNQSIKSNEIEAATLDTTSHNFTFQSWTFGTIGSSVLYDVAIVNESCIWAVGEIYVADTSANGYTMYNAVHWNGNEWNLKRITVNFRGFLITPALEGIFAFSPTQIWLAGGLAIFGDGTNWTSYDIRLITGIDGLSASKIWGSSPDSMYFVGRNGNIAHYNGSQWRKIESGTSLDIYDIWGDESENGEYEILMVAAQHFVGPERKILTIKNNSVQDISTSNISIGSLYGVWFKTGKKYFVVGNGIYTKTNVHTANSWNVLHNGLTPYYTYSIKGTAFNNIFICGSFGESLFFNGSNWTSFRSLPGFYNAEFYKTDIKENIIIAVGYRGSSGFITIGKR